MQELNGQNQFCQIKPGLVFLHELLDTHEIKEFPSGTVFSQEEDLGSGLKAAEEVDDERVIAAATQHAQLGQGVAELRAAFGQAVFADAFQSVEVSEKGI